MNVDKSKVEEELAKSGWTDYVTPSEMCDLKRAKQELDVLLYEYNNCIRTMKDFKTISKRINEICQSMANSSSEFVKNADKYDKMDFIGCKEFIEDDVLEEDNYD